MPLLDRPLHGGNLVWAASVAGCPPSSILDFSASINPLGPPQSAIAALQTALASVRAYPDPNYARLRAVLGEEQELEPEWILPGNGAAELLTWIGRELAALDEVWLMVPAFSDYWRALKTFGAVVRPWRLAVEMGDRNGLPLPVPEKGSRIGILLNNPHNPTGRLFQREQLLPYLEGASLVAIDEAFMDFLPPPEQESVLSLAIAYPNLVVLRSLTKFYSLPGLRLGYAVARPERLQRWQAWRDPWPVNSLAATVAEAILKDTDFQQQTWDWLKESRAELLAGLAAIAGLSPLAGAANFLLVRAETSVSQLQLALLQRHQILIRDCLSFPELGDAYFRVAVRTTADNQRLLAALQAEVIK